MDAESPLSSPVSASEQMRIAAGRAEIVDHLTRMLADGQFLEPLPGVRLRRADSVSVPVHGVSHPALCVIVQGAKEIFLGADRFCYDPETYLITTAELPIVSRITEATSAAPYLSVVIALDPALVSAVMAESGLLGSPAQSAGTAVAVSTLDADLLDPVVRMVRLAERPDEAAFMVPLIQREIVFRLLQGEQGGRLRYLTTRGGSAHRIVRAIERLRRDFAEPLRIDVMAGELGMSVSSFHHHFKAVTAMSPLQYQKQVRLQEARRLMLGEALDATSAGFRVGYDDASQFSREYKRQFGEPPMRDIERLRLDASLVVTGL